MSWSVEFFLPVNTYSLNKYIEYIERNGVIFTSIHSLGRLKYKFITYIRCFSVSFIFIVIISTKYIDRV